MVCGFCETIYFGEDLGKAVVGALRLDAAQCRVFAENYSWRRCTTQFFNNLFVPASRKANIIDLDSGAATGTVREKGIRRQG